MVHCQPSTARDLSKTCRDDEQRMPYFLQECQEHKLTLEEMRKQQNQIIKERKEHEQQLMKAEDTCKQLRPKIVMYVCPY